MLKGKILLNIAIGCNLALIVLGIVGILVDYLIDPVPAVFVAAFYSVAAALIFWSVGFAVAYRIANRSR